MSKHFYGWLADEPDNRDLVFKPKGGNLPNQIDLRSKFPPIYDQGDLGSCTANAIAGALDYQRVAQQEPLITPSRLFIYYNERKAEHSIKTDAGATIRESVKAVKKYGACSEKEWPYMISRFKNKPPKQAYKDALNYEDLLYRRVDASVAAIQECLANADAIVIGISVYESFESPAVANGGKVPMPAKGEQLLGGHAVVVVGYENERWICRNSWGADWGDRGYFYLPQEYLLDSNLSGDFWALTKVK